MLQSRNSCRLQFWWLQFLCILSSPNVFAGDLAQIINSENEIWNVFNDSHGMRERSRDCFFSKNVSPRCRFSSIFLRTKGIKSEIVIFKRNHLLLLASGACVSIDDGPASAFQAQTVTRSFLSSRFGSRHETHMQTRSSHCFLFAVLYRMGRKTKTNVRRRQSYNRF